MKTFIPILALLGVVAANPELHAKWRAYKATHGKDYAPHIEPARIEAFANNVRLIEEHNAKFARGEVSYELGLNVHSDLTPEEFREANLGLVYSEEFHANTNLTKHVMMPSARKRIDWRKRKAVSRVKNQATCGSCYAFASVALIESYLMKNGTERKRNKEMDLSEQDSIDCTYKTYLGMSNSGCKGGDAGLVLEEAIKKGIATENDYPYTSGDTRTHGTCQANQKRVDLSNFKLVEVGNNEEAFANALGNGPLVVSLNSSEQDFHHYSSGIYDSSVCSTTPTHYVLLVGFGEENGKKFWIIKNSWGTTWGENGFMKFARRSNHCGILTHPGYYLQ